MDKQHAWWLASAVCGLLTLVLVILLKFVDIQHLGEVGGTVGLGAINGPWSHWVGYRTIWQNVANFLGYLTLVMVGIFGIWQLFRWLQNQHRLPAYLWYADLILVLVAVIYIGFSLVSLNYRPFLKGGQEVNSFPVAHILLFTVVLPLLMVTIHREWTQRALKIIITVALGVMLVVGCAASVASGLHWLTDAVGSLLIAGTLDCAYIALTINQ